MAKAYNSADLLKLQSIELQIFKDFAETCKKYNLTYFTIGGTTIGAVRHKGFIPWDDDIDVCMLRSDYEKFAEIAPKEFEGKYKFVNFENTDNYMLVFGKLEKIGTKFVDIKGDGGRMDTGIFLDIFPFDKTPVDDAKRKKQIKRAWFWCKAYVIRHLGTPHIPGKGFKKTLFSLACKIAHTGMTVCRVSKKFLRKKYMKWATMYNNSDEPCLITDFSTLEPELFALSLEDYFPVKEVPFEDTTICIPNNYDLALTRQFGDYMTIPPVEKRKNHCPDILDFGDGE